MFRGRYYIHHAVFDTLPTKDNMSAPVPIPGCDAKKEAVRTANGAHRYDDVSFGLSLHEWVQKLHAHNCAASGWAAAPLRRGAFGYDNLAMSVAAVFLDEDAGPPSPLDVSSVAARIHAGWAENYVFWRDNAPWSGTFHYVYTKPYAPLGDAHRDLCAVRSYAELPADERANDDVLAEGLLAIYARAVARRV